MKIDGKAVGNMHVCRAEMFVFLIGDTNHCQRSMDVSHSTLRPISIPGLWDLPADCASGKARAGLAGLYVF